MTTETPILIDEQIAQVLNDAGLTEYADVPLRYDLEVARAIEQAVLQSPEIRALRKDAERYRCGKGGIMTIKSVLTSEQIRAAALLAGCDEELDDGAVVYKLARNIEQAVLQSDEVRKALATQQLVDELFSSGNDIPVERITIKRSDLEENK